MKSPVYWHPDLYHFIMRQLYGKDFTVRYEAIEKLIPENSDVVELCMGDAYLYRNYLSSKKINYLGLDINQTFVKAAIQKNIPAKIHNLLTDEIPVADYIIIQASLYQFIPREKKIIQKMLASAGKKLVIAEAIKNRADSPNPLVSFLAKNFVDPGTGKAALRFNATSLLECFRSFKEFREELTIESGKEMIGV